MSQKATHLHKQYKESMVPHESREWHETMYTSFYQTLFPSPARADNNRERGRPRKTIGDPGPV